MDCVMTVDDLTDSSDYELFEKVCSLSHSSASTASYK